MSRFNVFAIAKKQSKAKKAKKQMWLGMSKRKFIWQKSRINDQLLRDLPDDVERSFLSSNCVPWGTCTHFLRSKAYELNNMILAIIFKDKQNS